MKFSLSILSILVSSGLGFQAGAQAKDVFITIDSDASSLTRKSFAAREIDRLDGISLIQIDENHLEHLSHEMHEEHHRCGGYMLHDDLEDALRQLNSSSERAWAAKGLMADYNINQQETVSKLIDEVEDTKIENVIRKLSSYKTRHYRSQTGVDSQNWIKTHWESLVAGRTDAKVELYQHSSWPQPSVILTIEGESPETIVVGGHADSISGYFDRGTATAPGADDNASGIATITEIVRVLTQASYKPSKTLKFMAYAAEEVGLLGSKEIASQFKRNNVDVVGVLQLDMTNFAGTADKDIVMMTDYTNENQNAFLGSLIDEYLKLKWGYDRCGYGCSDHASWHGQGFPASIPFEARKNDMNRNIHTARDTIEQSGGHARHAAKFAKLGVAFVVEIDR